MEAHDLPSADQGPIKYSSFIRLATCETGSRETAPTATPSHRCSHYGMAQPSPLGFSLHSTRFQRSREGTPERRDASGARWRPRCGRIVSRAGFRGPGWAHVWPPGTPFPRKADGGSGLGTAQFCRPPRQAWRGQQLILRCGGTDAARQDTPPEPVKECEAGHSRDPSNIRLLFACRRARRVRSRLPPTATQSR